jgi:hypothetical protein
VGCNPLMELIARGEIAWWWWQRDDMIDGRIIDERMLRCWMTFYMLLLTEDGIASDCVKPARKCDLVLFGSRK